MTKRTGITSELFAFMRANRAYWMAPMILVSLMLIGLILLSAATGGAAAPFIYTLF